LTPSPAAAARLSVAAGRTVNVEQLGDHFCDTSANAACTSDTLKIGARLETASSSVEVCQRIGGKSSEPARSFSVRYANELLATRVAHMAIKLHAKRRRNRCQATPFALEIRRELVSMLDSRL